MSGGLIGGVSDALFGDGGAGQLEDIARRNQELYGNIQLPDLQYQTYNPEVYNPEMANASTVTENPLVKSAQMAALAKMAGLSDQGLSAEDQQAFEQANNQAGQRAQQASQAALQNAQARGVAGSGLEFAMKEMGNQAATQGARDASLNQAATSARNRVLANQAYMSALGQQRGQDYQASANNANILNQFNMANTNATNQGNQWNATNNNQAQQYNANNRNNIAQQTFNNHITKAGGQAGANNGFMSAVAAGQAARTANQNALISGGAKIAAAGM